MDAWEIISHMATYTQVKTGWRAQIRRKGHKSIARTFNTKSEAERWALQIESGMGVGTYVDNREALSTSLHACLERYAAEIVPHKKGAHRDLYRVKFWQGEHLASKGIGTIKQVDIAKWRDARIAAGYSGSTVKKDLALLSHVFTIAAKEWGFPLTNPVSMIRKPKSGLARDRRLHDGEEELLLEHCDTQEMRAFITLAIETAMRRGEIVGLQRKWINGRVAYLPDTKNGTPRAVPLSARALDAIASLPIRIDGKLFEFKEDAYTHSFIRVCKKAGIEDLHLHDLRHEATSRLFEKGLDVMQVKSITGHKSLQMLSRYTHLKADELARLLG
jgi:integrase